MTIHDTAAGVRSAASAWRTDMRWLAIATVGVLVALLFTIADATAQNVSPLPSKPTLDLPVGQGRLLRFNEPVESVLVADTTIADLQVVSPSMVYVFGLKPGLTNLIAVTADERIEATAQFRVIPDVTPASEAKHAMQPNSATNLHIFGTRIVITGEARGVDEAKDLDNVARTFSPPEQPPLNNMTVQGSQQVNIRVRFAEVSRTELQSYGVDWSVGYKSGGFEFNMFQDNGVPSGGDGNFGLSLDQAHGLNFDVLIEALQRNGVVKILAEPNLTAVTGQTANFLAGGEIPVPIAQGSDVTTIQYKPFGVSLGFTPTLIGRNRIALHVQPEVSSLSDAGAVTANGFAMPSFVVRRADTTVEVASGQTFAIAGLFQQRTSRNLEKFPVLGDVPVLGPLFQSQRFQHEETELVILITPYLVAPVRDSLATPLDRPAAKRLSRKHAKDASATGLIIK
ncbi:type II and III secretion system protein family protein [Mesorhizobium sp.]|uniref:type II and III secretion system protein family protein n=1 Tax=Mesorhizobium sp. TaxID=1871066 RepID=UPI000FE2E575|nr:type II and III secretion system protein family protein [Mesorhizobium sp.]RWG90737.1 MAG: type II and III secretion system protein family protein [Mesorhizobium sp.]RWK10640.1 MAG: type II and III secretion system protein family protein [Mesorhizobium sp.]RWK21318.1 MAG: type II and III secretion system protein family protein [Mesorhizobium sp.]RWK24810.1 MAG: type II and III secretion system protein family protein [Mesorhizobium sp.]RWK34799.1 MAG: type II and III secretion system protein